MTIKIKKSYIAIIILLICIPFSMLVTYKYTSHKVYNGLMQNAAKCVDKTEYNKALGLYEQALLYKNNLTAKSQLLKASNLKDLQATYINGITLMRKSYYKDAINEFTNVTDEEANLYKKAQEKIKECNTLIKDLNYEDSITYAENQ